MIDRIGEIAMDSVTLDNIAKIIDYPGLWDEEEYPTIEDAIRFMALVMRAYANDLMGTK